MPEASVFFVLTGLSLSVLLLAIGFWAGTRFRRPAGDPPVPNDEDRQRMVSLLQGLSRWTSEYSGSLSKYQAEVGQFGEEVQQSLARRQAIAASGGPDQGRRASDLRLVTLVGDMMTANDQLQKRLDVAEKQLEEQTRQIECYLTEARTDGLTGLFNRRAFDRKLDELFQVFLDSGSPFSLVLIDIDHFKSINDTYGHPVGDVVLQHLAGVLSRSLDDALMVARFGGEEFAVLSDAPLRATAERMNELRKKIAAEAISVTGHTLTITISVGVSRPNEDASVGPVVRRADEALYTAKKTGRDRVYFNEGRFAQLVGAPEVSRSR